MRDEEVGDIGLDAERSQPLGHDLAMRGQTLVR